ncbi:hypothetical protein ACSBR2_035376 [Camellia fascicularis]
MWSKALQSAILCTLVSLQRYTKALSSIQRASLVEKSRQTPQERIRVVTDVNSCLKSYCYDDDPLFVACGISIEKQPTQVDGRVLKAPKLKVGNGEDCIPRNGRWNCNNKFIKALQEDPSALKILTQRYALDDVGSQSHVHLSLWENGKNIFMASGEHSKHGMSKVGEEFMAGVLIIFLQFWPLRLHFQTGLSRNFSNSDDSHFLLDPDSSTC